MTDHSISDFIEHPEKTPLSTIVTFIAGIVYISGYLIHSIFVRNRGIGDVELVKAQYIETGLVFFCITTFLIIVPYVSTHMALIARRRAKFPINPSVMVAPLLATNYLYSVLFFALFITRPDWSQEVSLFGCLFHISSIATIYFVTLFILQICTPAIRHMSISTGAKGGWKLTNHVDRTVDSTAITVMIQVLRILSVAITLSFDYIILFKIPWMLPFLSRAVYFLLCLVIALVAIYVVIRFSRAYKEEGLNNRMMLISLPFFVAFYLVSVTVYTFGFYKNLPSSRGGKYPVTKTVLTCEDDVVALDSKFKIQHDGYYTTIPLYVIEEDDDYLYVLNKPVVDWFEDTGPIAAVPKDQILSMEIIPNMSTAPRTIQSD